MTSVHKAAPWWLQPGQEECVICFESVQYHAIYHCSRCDRPLCMNCSITLLEERTVVCHECQQEEGL